MSGTVMTLASSSQMLSSRPFSLSWMWMWGRGSRLHGGAGGWRGWRVGGGQGEH